MEVFDIILCRTAHPRSREDLIETLVDKDGLDPEEAREGIDLLLEERTLVESLVENVIVQTAEQPDLAEYFQETNDRVLENLQTLNRVSGSDWSYLSKISDSDFYSLTASETDSLFFETILEASEGFEIRLRVATSVLLEKTYCECCLLRSWAHTTDRGPEITTLSFPVAGNEGEDLSEVVISCLKRARKGLAKIASAVPSF